MAIDSAQFKVDRSGISPAASACQLLLSLQSYRRSEEENPETRE
jgi:hypothetical protein